MAKEKLQDLIREGIVTLGVSNLLLKVKDKKHFASIIKKEGHLIFCRTLKKSFRSLSAWALTLIRKLYNPERASINGWSTVYYSGENVMKKSVKMITLRKSMEEKRKTMPLKHKKGHLLKPKKKGRLFRPKSVESSAESTMASLSKHKKKRSSKPKKGSPSQPKSVESSEESSEEYGKEKANTPRHALKMKANSLKSETARPSKISAGAPKTVTATPGQPRKLTWEDTTVLHEMVRRGLVNYGASNLLFFTRGTNHFADIVKYKQYPIFCRTLNRAFDSIVAWALAIVRGCYNPNISVFRGSESLYYTEENFLGGDVREKLYKGVRIKINLLKYKLREKETTPNRPPKTSNSPMSHLARQIGSSKGKCERPSKNPPSFDAEDSPGYCHTPRGKRKPTSSSSSSPAKRIKHEHPRSVTVQRKYVNEMKSLFAFGLKPDFDWLGGNVLRVDYRNDKNTNCRGKKSYFAILLKSGMVKCVCLVKDRSDEKCKPYVDRKMVDYFATKNQQNIFGSVSGFTKFVAEYHFERPRNQGGWHRIYYKDDTEAICHYRKLRKAGQGSYFSASNIEEAKDEGSEPSGSEEA